MTADDIQYCCYNYKYAVNPLKMVNILADQFNCSNHDMKELLELKGFSVPDMKLMPQLYKDIPNFSKKKKRRTEYIRWTDEEKKFVADTLDKRVKTVAVEFEKKFGRAISENTIRSQRSVICRKYGVTANARGRVWTEEEDNWLKENYTMDKKVSEIADELNTLFDSKRSVPAIQMRIAMLLPTSAKRPRRKRSKNERDWTEKDIDSLLTLRAEGKSAQEISEYFCSVGRPRTKRAIWTKYNLIKGFWNEV